MAIINPQNSNSFDPTSLGAKPVQGAFDPTTIGAKPYNGSQDINNSAALLGVTNNVNAMQRDATGKATPEQMDTFNQQDQQAKDTADQANSTAGIAQQTGQNTVSALGNSALKFVGSAIRAPIDIVRGMFGYEPLQGGMKDFSGNDMSSIQSDFSDKANQIASGDPNAPSPLAATASAVGQTVGGAADVLGAGEGLSAAKTLGERTFGDALAQGGIDANRKAALAQTVQDVSPRLTQSVAETTPTKTTGLLRKITPVASQDTIDTANAVHNVISSGKTFSEKANLADNAIVQKATELKADIASVDHAVPKRELMSALQKTERPDLVASDPTLNGAMDRVVARAGRIIDNMKGTVSGALDGRQAFDQAIKQQFPKLYDGTSQSTATKEAIKNLRNTWNQFIEDQLPDDESFRESLDQQSKLYDARDTLREKAARGAPTIQGEIGTTAPQRFAASHPLVTKGVKVAAGGAAGAVGAGAVYEGAKNTLGQ